MTNHPNRSTKNTIACTVGIYSTLYRLTNHKDGSVSVKAPYIRWSRGGSTGNLDFRTYRVAHDQKANVVKFFDEQTTALPATNCIGGYATLQDILDGHLTNSTVYAVNDLAD